MPSPVGCVCPRTKPLLSSVQRCCMTFSAMTGAVIYSAAICTGIPASSASCACTPLCMDISRQSAPDACSAFQTKSAMPSHGTCFLLQPCRARASHGLSHLPTKSSLPEKWLPLSAAICPPHAAKRCPNHKKSPPFGCVCPKRRFFVLIGLVCSSCRAAFCVFGCGGTENKLPAARLWEYC